MEGMWKDRRQMPPGEGKVGLWVIEDDPMFRKAVERLFDGSEGLTCEQTFETCEDALTMLQREGAPQVVLVDIGLSGMSGIEGIRRMKTLSPSTEFVVLTIHEDHQNVFEAVCAGASGYLVKSVPLDQIVERVQEVVDGGVPMNPSIARKVLSLLSHKTPSSDVYGLTDREKEILNLMIEGLTRNEMAERLFISPSTVLTHSQNIYAKLHVHRRGSAVAKALKERLL